MLHIASQRAAHLLDQFQNQSGLPPKMAIGNAEIRTNIAYLNGGVWEDDSPGNSFFLIHPNDPSKSSVWAHPHYTGYKDAYRRFITRAYKIPSPQIPAGLDIDHLQAKATCPPGAVIRLEAVDASSNRSHGSGVEARFSKSRVTAGRMERNYTPGSMTWLVALKLAGVLSPQVASSRSAAERYNAAVDYFVGKGWPRQTVEKGLVGLFEVIDRH